MDRWGGVTATRALARAIAFCRCHFQDVAQSRIDLTILCVLACYHQTETNNTYIHTHTNKTVHSVCMIQFSSTTIYTYATMLERLWRTIYISAHRHKPPPQPPPLPLQRFEASWMLGREMHSCPCIIRVRWSDANNIPMTRAGGKSTQKHRFVLRLWRSFSSAFCCFILWIANGRA